MLIVTAPLWFKAPFQILRLFVREKLRDRVYTVSISSLSSHVPLKSLPVHLGGLLQIDHSTWLLHCHRSMTNREDEILANIRQPIANTTATIQSSTTTTTATTAITTTDEFNNCEVIVSTKTPNGDNHSDKTSSTSTTSAVVDNSAGSGSDTTVGEFWSENPPSSASSGFSDDDSLVGADGDPKNIDQIVEMVREKGRQGLFKEYADIRLKAQDGTFDHAR